MYRQSRCTGTSLNHRFLELYSMYRHMYIFPTIAHCNSYLIASNCCYYIAMPSHSVYTCIHMSSCTSTPSYNYRGIITWGDGGTCPPHFYFAFVSYHYNNMLYHFIPVYTYFIPL